MDALQELFERFGVVIVFINALLHELAVPIPLTPTVLLAGAASSEVFAFAVLVAAVVAGTVIGNAIWFAAGRRFGVPVLNLLCRFSLSPDTCVARTSDGFGRWGSALFIVGRFLPGVSLLAPPVAGALGMRWSKFLWLTALGAAIWAVVIILIGALLQEALAALIKTLAVLPAGIWLAAGAVVLGSILWRLAVRRRARRALDVPRLPVAELRAAMQSAEVPVVIDVRGDTMQQILAQRIPGAVSLGLEDLEQFPLERIDGREVVLYCACPHEASAAAGAKILRSRGHANAHALRGGLAAWLAAGYEVEICRADLPVDSQGSVSKVAAL